MRKVAKFFSGLLSASLAFNFAAPAVSQYIAAAETEIASLSEVIRAGFENYETSIDISRFELTAEDVPRIVEVINYVRTIPELFYISVDGNGTVSQVQKEGTSDYIIGTLNVKYNNTYEEAKPLIEEFNAKADEIISEVITDDMTELQKALKLHDYLVLNTVYDTKGELEDLNGGASAYDILVCGNGICQGYAQAYNVLLERAGMDSLMVVSYPMKHAWNLVSVDDEWYHVDVTWDDPVPDSPGLVNHKYFLLSDEEIQKKTDVRYEHHSWDAKGFTATSTKYDNAFWVDVRTEIICQGDRWYYMSGSGAYSTYIESTGEVNTNVSVCEESWPDWNNPAAFYTAKYSSLIISDGVLLFNTPTQIYKMNLDGSNKQGLRYVNPYETNGYVYGLRIIDDKLYAVIKQEPLAEGTLYEITDVDIHDINFEGKVSVIDTLLSDIMYMEDGSSKKYTMDTETILPAEAIECMKGRDIRLTLELDGYNWDISGKNVTAEEANDLNLEIKRDQGEIPESMIASVSNATSKCIELNLTHNGEFGLSADINYNVGAEFSNKIAVLYYYNQAESTMDELEFTMIDNEGNINLNLYHASSYAVIVQDAQSPSDPIISEQEKPPQTEEPAVTTVTTTEAPEETTAPASETTVSETTTVTSETTAAETTIESSLEVEPEVVKGDITMNGLVDVTDLTYLSLACLSEYKLSDIQFKAADVNEDGKVNLSDLARVRQRISNIIEKL